MAKMSKRKQAAREKVDSTKAYIIDEALGLVKELATAKFPESIDVSVNLGVDPRKSDQVVRGSTVLPNGTGKTVRVAVFAQGENAEKATAAGADIVGFEDLAESVKAGEMNFDVVIATPDAMRVVGQLGQILGPRGLMPNPKLGTVTMDVAKTVAAVKSGQIEVRTDKAGVIHAPVGRRSFDAAKLVENARFLVDELNRMKPASSKGRYMQSMTVSSTMGAGVPVDTGSL
jgi:large subunit ribosomal protein L1